MRTLTQSRVTVVLATYKLALGMGAGPGNYFRSNERLMLGFSRERETG